MAKGSKQAEPAQDPASEVETVPPAAPEQPQITSVADLGREIAARENAALEAFTSAARAKAEEAELLAALEHEDAATRFKRETPAGLDVYEVLANQSQSIQLRGQLFQPGHFLRAAPDELVAHQLPLVRKL